MRRKLKITALFITIIALPLLFGCDDLYKNYIRNDTDESISVAYVTFSSDEVKTCTLGLGKVFDKPTRDNGEFFKDAWVYDGKEPGIRDNAFHVDASSVFVITKEEKVTYTLDVAIAGDKWNDEEMLYLVERSGKIGRYHPDDSMIKLENNRTSNIDVYSADPHFMLVDENGDEKKSLGGYNLLLSVDVESITVS